ncbi:MAG: hypothetical protein ACLQG3_01390 [Terracidiphilus sp.]
MKSKEEILATLDENGRLENMPFMPEMFQYCGQRLQVFKSAHKTCDYLQAWSIRRLKDSVHLSGVRCDGSGHEGCEASCLIFWKDAWLRREGDELVEIQPAPAVKDRGPDTADRCTEEKVVLAASYLSAEGKTHFRCQVTDVTQFTSRMSFWNPRQYLQDLVSGNVSGGLAGTSWAERFLDAVLACVRILHATIIGFFNEIQLRRGRKQYPFINSYGRGMSNEPLNLQPGELVEVRSKEEIEGTLDQDQKNQGLWFDSEMLPYCGGIYRVLRRVGRIIDERTGRMIKMKHPSIVLEGVVCKADFHRLCPRAIYPYWRESWLKRIQNPGEASVGNEKGSAN